MKVAAAIPAWNEQKAISSVVLLAREHVDKVLVVNDGSRDRTGLLARITYPDVNLLPIGSMYLIVTMVVLMNYLWFCGIMLSGVNRASDRMPKMIVRSGDNIG